jgi:hypothetical protein
MSLKKTKTKKLTENPSESIIIEHKVRNIIDLTKNKEICEEITRSSCWRPDIFFRFRMSRMRFKRMLYLSY